MSGKNPHPGDMHHGQIPVGCPIPPSLGLDIDRCISYVVQLFLFLVEQEATVHRTLISKNITHLFEGAKTLTHQKFHTWRCQMQSLASCKVEPHEARALAILAS